AIGVDEAEMPHARRAVEEHAAGDGIARLEPAFVIEPRDLDGGTVLNSRQREDVAIRRHAPAEGAEDLRARVSRGAPQQHARENQNPDPTTQMHFATP